MVLILTLFFLFINLIWLYPLLPRIVKIFHFTIYSIFLIMESFKNVYSYYPAPLEVKLYFIILFLIGIFGVSNHNIPNILKKVYLNYILKLKYVVYYCLNIKYYFLLMEIEYRFIKNFLFNKKSNLKIVIYKICALPFIMANLNLIIFLILPLILLNSLFFLILFFILAFLSSFFFDILNKKKLINKKYSYFIVKERRIIRLLKQKFKKKTIF